MSGTTDIRAVYERDSLAIHDFTSSLKHDVNLVRTFAGVPKTVNIFGYLFNIDTDEFTLVVEDAENVYSGQARA